MLYDLYLPEDVRMYSLPFPTDFVDMPTEVLTTIVNVNVIATLHVTSLTPPFMVSGQCHPSLSY
jgi:hypothetical protein